MATIGGRPRPPLVAERRFYLGMAILILLIMFAGFAPSFYMRGTVPPYRPYLPMNGTVLLHGLLFTSWLLLFVAQASLISAKRPDLHRKLGLAAFVLLPAMIVIGFMTALDGVARHSGPPDISPLTWLAVPVFDIPVFTGLIGAALYKRRDPQVHKRLMLCALISLTPPGTGRLPGLNALAPFPTVEVGAQVLLLGALAIWDLRSRGRVHPVTIIAGVVMIGSWLLRIAIWQTEGWMNLAAWLASFA
jgi:hypothetical protein